MKLSDTQKKHARAILNGDLLYRIPSGPEALYEWQWMIRAPGELRGNVLQQRTAAAIIAVGGSMDPDAKLPGWRIEHRMGYGTGWTLTRWGRERMEKALKRRDTA